MDDFHWAAVAENTHSCDDMKLNDDEIITIIIKTKILNIFTVPLQKGFNIRGAVGYTIREFLNNCGLDNDYINNDVTTVFLDNKPVDNLDGAYVQDGSRLSLSGSMPGLVGAVMRVKSPFQSFRQTISFGEGIAHTAVCQKAYGLVELKLFNTVLSDTMKVFLQKGIIIDSCALTALILANTNDFINTPLYYKQKLFSMNGIVDLLSIYQDTMVEVIVSMEE